MKDQFTRSEAEAVIGSAVRSEAEGRETFSLDEVEAAAAEVGVSSSRVHDAIARGRAAEEQRKAARQRRRAIGRVILVGLAGFSLLGALSLAECFREASGELGDAYESVRAARATVELAYGLRGTIPTLREIVKDNGELAAATDRIERRIYVARRDYDLKAQAYNRSATGWSARNLVLPYSVLPARVAYASAAWGNR